MSELKALFEIAYGDSTLERIAFAAEVLCEFDIFVTDLIDHEVYRDWFNHWTAD